MSAELERLLKVGVKAVRSGNTVAARGLFRALAREYPNDTRVWLGLAGSAGDRDEQRYALEQVLALDPQHVAARNGLARLDASLAPAIDLEPATLPPPPPPPQPEPAYIPPPPADDRPTAPTDSAAETITTTAVAAEPREGYFPLLNRLALGVIAALALALLVLLFWPRNNAQPQAGGTAPTAILAATSTAPTALGTAAPLPTTMPVASTAPTASATLEPTLAVPTLPAASPTPAVLPLGAVVEVDGWRATLLRPDYALLLDGSIGELQPNGRFVLALMAVSNGAAEPRTLPADLFTLTDNLQRTYTPLPNASSIYLATYGPEYGEQALEQPFAAQSGMVSIPLLFDVPPDAAGFTLTLRSGGPGWPISGGDTSGVGP